MIAVGAGLNVRYRDLIYRWTKEEVPLPRLPNNKSQPGQQGKNS
jgi:hypothetical protein